MLMGMNPAIRKTVYYSGHVQGVGFRWTAARIAGGHEVTGCVRNLPDGRVELIAEGVPKAVEGYLDEVAEVMGQHIRQAKTDTSPATGEFVAFNIRH